MLEVTIDPSFTQFVATTVARLGYLYPRQTFSAEIGLIRVEGAGFDPAAMRRDVLHTLYRERILEQTMPLRRRLIEGLLSR